MTNKMVIIGAVIVVLIVAAAVVYFGMMNANPGGPIRNATTGNSTTSSGSSSTSGGGTSSTQYANVPVGMTDPPSVPSGTQAVIVSYSQVQVQTKGGAWVNATGSGTVNALAVVNASQTIADAKVAVNSTISAVRINVTSVKVVVNKTTYTAKSPAWVTANVTSNQSVKSNSAVLVNVASNVMLTTNATTGGAYWYTAASTKAALTTNATVAVNVGVMTSLSAAVKSGLGLNIG